VDLKRVPVERQALEAGGFVQIGGDLQLGFALIDCAALNAAGQIAQNVVGVEQRPFQAMLLQRFADARRIALLRQVIQDRSFARPRVLRLRDILRMQRTGSAGDKAKYHTQKT
jgi:hypothetical protein